MEDLVLHKLVRRFSVPKDVKGLALMEYGTEFEPAVEARAHHGDHERSQPHQYAQGGR